MCEEENKIDLLDKGDPTGYPEKEVSSILTKKNIIIIGIVVVAVAGGIFGFIRHSALVKSAASYAQAQSDLKNSNLNSAIAELRQVVPYDSHYQNAQKQISTLKQAVDLIQLISDLGTESSKYDSDMSIFWNDYNGSINNLNPAWQNYSYGNAKIYLDAATKPVNALGVDNEEITQDVSTISTSLGAAQSNQSLSNFDTKSLLQAYDDSSTQTDTLANTVSNELTSLETNSSVYSSVAQDISTGNIAFSSLQTDQLSSDHLIAQYIGYISGIAKNLIEENQ